MSFHTDSSCRCAVGLAFGAAFLILWLNAAVGLIGVEDDDLASLKRRSSAHG